MGVFQSVGGAATSGGGFKGDQITSAIVAALINANYNEGQGARNALGSDVLTANEYKKEHHSSTPYVAVERNAFTTVEVTEYAPFVFHTLRGLCGTSDVDFLREWDIFPAATRTVLNAHGRTFEGLGREQASGGGLELGEGRSMALFLKSRSMMYMCKTISEAEVHVLVSMLHKYLAHIERSPDSMLMRFVMLLKVTVNTTTYTSDCSRRYDGVTPLTRQDFNGKSPLGTSSEVGFVLCFNDCFSNCDVLHERWDLKGRKPKPGKFRHFPKHQLYRNRVVQPKAKQRADEQHSVFDSNPSNQYRARQNRAVPPEQQGFTELDDERRQQADLSSDEDGFRRQGENLRDDKTLESMRLNTLKDKDLARLFWLEPADRQYLIQQVTSDFKFLFECGLMDYSILIGVRYNTPEEQQERELRRLVPATTEKRIAGNGSRNRPPRNSLHAMKMPFVLGEEDHAGIIEVRPSSPALSPRGGAVPESYSPRSSPTKHDALDDFHSQFHQGVDSIECVETYYIGIIDMLTVYSGKKKVANFCKKILWVEDTLSTIPPKRYAERIEKYAHRIFPRVALAACDDGTLQPQKQSLLIGRGKVSTHALGFKVAKELKSNTESHELLVAPPRN